MPVKRFWGFQPYILQIRAEPENGSSDRETHRADELASKLAYECGWRLCDDALSVLESQRTRAATLLTVTILAVGVAASVFLDANFADDLELWRVLGLILFGIGTAGVMFCTVMVAWPIKTETALSPKEIVKNYIKPQEENRNPSWIYKNLARDLENAYTELKTTLTKRNRFYKCSLICPIVVLVGVVIIVADVSF
ncbi:MAG: hypothetical protein OXI96_01705 [Acidimicrobiaceae bacterium]|nr:hypothetical protein [Acidimicrobiaceae bacterium]